MIINFTLENWKSFRNKATFSMVASRERQHGDRLPRLKKYQTRVLPIAAIYGGNASGKTNFFQALRFVRDLVVEGTQPDNFIPVEPFSLDNSALECGTRFGVELLINEIIYDFSFALTRDKILEEKLVVIKSSSEKILYHRIDKNIKFEESLSSNDFLHFAFKGTRNNQLFLTNSVSQQIDVFQPVYDWFRHNLELIAPDSRFQPFEKFFDEIDPLYTVMNEKLSQLDTGITRLGSEEIAFSNLPLPSQLKTELQEKLGEGESIRLMSDTTSQRYVVTRRDGKLYAKELVTYHLNTDGSEVKFNILQESDGSNRVIELLPAFLELSNISSKKVYVIDEIDRSLHSLLIRELIEAYLANCTESTRSQLLFTTHDLMLMDQQLLRRDEMWLAERNLEGVSEIFSFSDYKEIRYDSDIRKIYLQGRLGGIPRIFIGNSIDNIYNKMLREDKEDGY